MELLARKKSYDFMGYRKVSGMISIGLVLISLVVLITNSLNFGIDFTGGTQIVVEYADTVKADVVRAKLKEADYRGFKVSHYGSAKEILISIPPTDKDKIDNSDDKSKKGYSNAEDIISSSKHKDIGQSVLRLLKDTSDKPIILKRSDHVGSQVGEELTEDGGLALLTALFCILLYVAFRFEWRFAVGSVTALVHDVMIVLGIFALTQIEFDLSVLAALLAVIGYSLNDTIVVFDRIRENFRKIRKGTSVEIVNTSINETLSRTIMTSLTTLIVLTALLLLGGESIRGFSIALIIGVVIGTYSSIFVASNAALRLGVSRADMMIVKKEGVDLEDDGSRP